MPTLPNQSAPSAYFSPAKVTRRTVQHITAHSLAALPRGNKKLKDVKLRSALINM